MSGDTAVLHIINGEFYAGAERVQDLLALRLPYLGYRVEFACLKNGLFSRARKARNTPLHEFPMRSKFDLVPAFRIAALAKAEGYRLIHTHSPRTALIGRLAASIAGLPMIHHVHSPTSQDTETGWRNARNSVMESLSLPRDAILVCVSQTLERYLVERGFARRRIRTVWNGVPIQEKGRKAMLPGGPMVVGTVALFRPRKGLEVLLRAMAELRGAGWETILHAVGSFETESYRMSVMSLVSELGLSEQVRWRGFTDHVAEEFRHMNVFVLPSLFGEGMPMVVLEAMAAGLPVIATRVEGIPSVIRDGVDGLLVRPGDAGELAGALRGLASGEMDDEALGDSGWLRQRELFSDRAMAEGVAAIYRQAIWPNVNSRVLRR